MSQVILVNGHGKSNKAKVSEDGELFVKPFPIDLHSRSQLTGRAYSLYMKRDIATANTEEPLGYIEYNGTGRAVISELSFSMAFTDIAETQGGRIEVHVIDGQSLSNGTSRTPIPMNRGNQVASGSIALSGEGTLISGFTIDATTEIYHTQLMTTGDTNNKWVPQDGWLMEKGHSILVTAKGYTGGVSLPGFRCTMRFFEEDLETQ